MFSAVHIKTGNIYIVTGFAIDATNDSKTEGMEMVIYRNGEGMAFVRQSSTRNS